MVAIEGGTRNPSVACELLGAGVIFDFVVGDEDSLLGLAEAFVGHFLLCKTTVFHDFIIHLWAIKLQVGLVNV